LKATEDITMFMTTHYLDEAEYCDRIAIMDNGQIIALDTPEALKASVGKDRIRITTDDDAEAIRCLKERFALRPRSPRVSSPSLWRRVNTSCLASSPIFRSLSDRSTWPARRSMTRS
jgi:ABC-type multidrug transport system ATPase subunit